LINSFTYIGYMEKKSKWSKGMKILGISLLLLAIPGSTFLLPVMLGKKLKNDKSKDVLGI
jgi:hypothetical protein